ncbi:MAG TPA: CvpA family protein [Candidatus Pullilachnospira intestinigallinarum]|nr:CvpA family protein [Candidatus Pullilachnospira intestinigallinarum]
MSWLFWILLVIFALFVIQGARKGLVRTAVSMVSVILVIAAVSWINPYVGDFIREHTGWEESIQEHTSQMLAGVIEEQMEPDAGQQEEIIRQLPLPDGMKDFLLKNNTVEGYQNLAAESFADYVSGYLAYAVINGIAFVLSFVVTILLIRLILYAVDILTDLPVISGLNRAGGIVLGAVQGLLWLWIILLAVALFAETPAGRVLMEQIRGDLVLNWLYNNNFLTMAIMRILS